MGKDRLINYDNNIFWTQIQRKIYMVFLKYFQIKYFCLNIIHCHLTFILNLGLDMSCFAFISCSNVCEGYITYIIICFIKHFFVA